MPVRRVLRPPAERSHTALDVALYSPLISMN